MGKNKEKSYIYDKRIDTKINYISHEELKERYPEGEYSIIGEISTKEKNEKGVTKKLINEEKNILVQPIGT